MPELLKNVYSQTYLLNLAAALQRELPEFAVSDFVAAVMAPPWQTLELKARMRHIADHLQQFLPADYPVAVQILQKIAPQFTGYAALLFPEFVACFGLEDYEVSIAAMAVFTEFSSSEFAIRPFLQRYPQTLHQMLSWADSDNPHLRRLASEGSRPRLPWAMALPDFKKNPQQGLAILEKLRADKSLYVRKSVANHLNDIAKDHPDLVLAVAGRWQGQSVESNWIIRHACRSLLKQAHPQALALFGFAAQPELISQFNCDAQVSWGQPLNLWAELHTTARVLGRLRVDYHLYFLRARGDYGCKVFRWFEGELTESHQILRKKLTLKSLSTRNYHLGVQRLVLVVNGQPLQEVSFTLTH